MPGLLTLHDPTQARDYYRRGLWRADSCYGLLAEHARARPRAYALRDGARRLTWAGLLSWVDAVAARLHGAGLDPGARLSLLMSNRAEAVALFLAANRNGYVCNPSLHRTHSAAEVIELLGAIGAAALFVEAGHGAAADGGLCAKARQLPTMRLVAEIASEPHPGTAMPAPEAAPEGPLPPVASNPDAVCYIAFTSGTTGMPKGVMHSHNTLLANARDLVADWGHGPATVILPLSPVSHHIAWVAAAQALVAGAELVLNQPPAGIAMLDWIIETGASYVLGVPTHAMDVLAEQRRRGLARLGAVKVFYIAGAPIPPAVADGFRTQGIMPQNVYGMTENSSHQYTHPGDDAKTIVETCGRGGRSYEVRIFDPERREVELPVGAVGEIGGRGAALMLGYFADQEATEAAFNRTGWFMSGDLGRLDEAGCLSIVGRIKDLVIRGGRNIYPARIEALALTHPDVAKAAAFGLPDERLGEKLCLAVLPAGANPPDADSILLHLAASGLSKHDMPEFYVVLESLPLTASGKILKRELSAWVKAGRIVPRPIRFKETAS